MKMETTQSLKQSLSTYSEGLPEEAKPRYNTKLAVIDGIDPFMNRSLGDPRIVTRQWTPPIWFCN